MGQSCDTCGKLAPSDWKDVWVTVVNYSRSSCPRLLHSADNCQLSLHTKNTSTCGYVPTEARGWHTFLSYSLFTLLFFFFLRQVSLWAQNSLMRLHWLISKCRWSSCLHPPPAPTCYRAQLLHNVEDLNSCLQGYMLRTLSMETSPQSLSARFVLKIVLKFKST